MQKPVLQKIDSFLGILFCCVLTLTSSGQSIETQNSRRQLPPLVVDLDAVKIPVPATMWGIFFEDINFAADGGIYAELVKNRSFEFADPFMGWETIDADATATTKKYLGKALVAQRGPIEIQAGNWANNQHFLQLTINEQFGIRNQGYRAMGFHGGEIYHFAADLRTKADLQIQIQLTDSLHNIVAKTDWSRINKTGKWESIQLKLSAEKDVLKGRLEIHFKGNGSLDADMISLFPEHTWKNRPGGLRADLVQKLADLHPGFVRFPGGCIVEGRTLANRYQWKNTVGPVSKRKIIVNRWNTEFQAPRDAPDYFQSYGLGFFEYFQLAEDLGAAPLPILNCGMACQFNSGEVAIELGPYIQDALDLIEFANGNTATKWGRLRQEMGHPAPFHLKYLGIGNEQWDTQYFERYSAFAKVLQQKHPEIKLISGTGPYAEGSLFDQAWDSLRYLKPALVDEHYYKPPSWFLAHANRYDQYDRSGPKVFAGEYAAHGKSTGDPTSGNSWYSALTEAAFMTGLERNADVVNMASYAPLLAHIDAWQWRPDLIWFNNLHSMATPNYYVQQLFSTAKGRAVLKTTYQGQPAAGSDSLYANSTLDSTGRWIHLKLVNTGKNTLEIPVALKGTVLDQKATGTWELLTADQLDWYNSLASPNNIRPNYIKFDLQHSNMTRLKNKHITPPQLSAKSSQIILTLPPYSVNLITLPIQLPHQPSSNAVHP